MKTPAILAALTLPLAACNQNTAIGNDQEAQIDPAPSPAPIMRAGQALGNVATAIVKPETMNNADIQALGGKSGRCAIKLTQVSFPSFFYEPDGPGSIKLNGKLIVMKPTGSGRYQDGDLNVTLRPVDGEGSAGLTAIEMIIVLPGAKNEIGYRGFVQCFGKGSA